MDKPLSRTYFASTYVHYDPLIVSQKEAPRQHLFRAVVRGGAEGALAPPKFGSSVNPIPSRGGGLLLAPLDLKT